MRKPLIAAAVGAALFTSFIAFSSDWRVVGVEAAPNQRYEVRTDEVNTGRGYAWLTRITDKERGTTCYLLAVEKHISCVKH